MVKYNYPIVDLYSSLVWHFTYMDDDLTILRSRSAGWSAELLVPSMNMIPVPRVAYISLPYYSYHEYFLFCTLWGINAVTDADTYMLYGRY
jgi:hypothetical protein